MRWFWPIIVLAMALVSKELAAGECSCDGGGSPCQEGYCCSTDGYCGVGDDWCSPHHCQCQCPAPSPPTPPPPPPSPPSNISSIIDIYLFDELLKRRNETGCEHYGFYTYSDFIEAANSYPDFGTTGDLETRKREIVAFLAQTSSQTTGPYYSPGDWDPAEFGYCFVTEDIKKVCCVESVEYPCVDGKEYYGRGPIQLKYNYNYGLAGAALGYDLLSDPDALARDAVLSFKSALWFWMTPQSLEPSCHDVITGQWVPSSNDEAANRQPGYGVITNIINGKLECSTNDQNYIDEQNNRISFYKAFCDRFGLSYGDFIDCFNQKPFGLECRCDGVGSPCPVGYCCNTGGYCGVSDGSCSSGKCQCQCPVPPPPSPTPPAPPSPISSIIDIYLFDELLKNRNDSSCEYNGFYTYYAFITAANSFPGFGTTGDLETCKREIAAFLAQTSHETTGPFYDPGFTNQDEWGYCFVTEDIKYVYCDKTSKWSCAPGRAYYGRGPIQLKYNYNYGLAGEALGHDLINDPDALVRDTVLSFKSALWYWMTPQSLKPSCHDVITGQWVPSSIDEAANRHPGYGVITNIINGKVECSTKVQDDIYKQDNRIIFYKSFCDKIGVSYGDFIDCFNQTPFDLGEFQDM